MKQTPLYDRYVALGGKIIDFGGWALPVEFQGIVSEHACVRERAGLFDVSHMGEFTVEGPGAQEFINSLVTNDITRAKECQAVYSPMCYPDGGVVDDLLVYKYTDTRFLLVVNAANIEKDFNWVVSNNHSDVQVRNISDEIAQLALQGPAAQEVLQTLTDVPLADIKFFHFVPEAQVAGVTAILSRSGYTGEDGFELYVSAADAGKLWDAILEAGRAAGVQPIGLGARDTLRFEAALPLYGHELSAEINPLEANLKWFVKLDKPNFIGRDALLSLQEKGLSRKLVGLRLLEGGMPRSQFLVAKDDQTVGFVTSGSMSQDRTGLAMALVDIQYAVNGTELDIVIRNKNVRAQVVDLPFYQKKYKK